MNRLGMNDSALRDRLVAQGEALLGRAGEPPRYSNNSRAEVLLHDLVGSPHAFVFACLADRQVPAERAWAIPGIIEDRTGTFDLQELGGLTANDWLRILQEPPVAHRFPEKMATVLLRATARILTEYRGDAAAIWSDHPGSARLVRRFLAFHGAGPKIATMAANILVRDFHIDLADYRYIDISADSHVRRVMGRLGLVDTGASIEDVIYAAREMNPDFPGVFDLVLWQIGRTTCRPSRPDCGNCRLKDQCPSA